MSAHEYWRVRFLAGNGTDIWLSEVEFRDASGDLLSPTGATPISAGDYSAAYGKAQAFDGVTSGANPGWASATVPTWIGLQFAGAVDVGSARVYLYPGASASDELPAVGATRLEYSDNGTDWTDAGHIFAGVVEFGGVLNSMLRTLLSVANVRSVGAIQGRVPERYTTTAPAPPPGRLAQDFRSQHPTTGTISDQVVLKAAGVDLPFANGRVWLLRLADGYKAWEGWSDAAGNYAATGLEIGVEYLAVGIDPYRNQKTAAAGPVTAV